MDDNLTAIASKALVRLAPLIEQANERSIEITFAPTDRFLEGSLRAERKGTGFMKRGAPEPGTPVHWLSITGILNAGIAHPEPFGFMLDIADPTTTPQLEVDSSWTLVNGEITPEQIAFDQLAPYALELLDAPAPT